jgi:hypothetical protein
MTFITKQDGLLRSARSWALLGLTLIVIGALGGTPEASGQPSWPQVVSLPACLHANQVVTADLSTGTTNGVKNPLGSGDPKWHVIEVPVGQTGLWQAYSYRSTAPGPWFPNPATGANWIGRPKPVGPFWNPPPTNGGDYRYRVRFYLDLSLYSSIQIVGQFGSDDASIVQLNKSLGPASAWVFCFSNCFTLQQPLTIPATPVTGPSYTPFINGVNDLEVIVTNNQGTITGIFVDARLEAKCKSRIVDPIPITFPITFKCDREIKKTVTPNPVQSGDTVNIKLTVKNVGILPCPAVPGISVADPLSPELTNPSPITVSEVNNPTGTWTAGSSGGVVWGTNPSALPGGHEVQFIFTAKVNASPGSYQKCAVVSNIGEAPADNANNQFCVTISVVP